MRLGPWLPLRWPLPPLRTGAAFTALFLTTGFLAPNAGFLTVLAGAGAAFFCPKAAVTVGMAASTNAILRGWVGVVSGDVCGIWRLERHRRRRWIREPGWERKREGFFSGPICGESTVY